MKRKLYAAFFLFAVVAAALSIQGCRNRKHATLRLRYWGDLEEIRIVEGICRDFEKTHPGVHIAAERKDFAGYADLLLQEFAADVAPDVIFLSPDNVDRLTHAHKMADLSPYLEAEKDLKKTDYYEPLIQRFSTDGKLWLLPRDIAPIAVIYYNKDLFDKAKLPYPQDEWHWEDLRQDAKRLTVRDSEGKGVQWGFVDDWNISEAWMLSAGGQQVDDYLSPSRLTLGSGAAAEGLLFRWKLLQKDRVMPSSSDNKALAGGNQALFTEGKAAMFHSGIWKTPAFRKIQGFQWDVVRFPTKAGAKDPGFPLGGSGYGMRDGAADPATCWALIKALAGPSGEELMAMTGLTQPALKALAASSTFLDGQDPKNKQMLIYAAQHGHMTPVWEPWDEFLHTVWSPTTDPVWLDGYEGDPAAVFKQAQDEGNKRFFKKADPQ